MSFISPVHPFMVPITTTLLNRKAVPNVKPLPPHKFFFMSTGVPGSGKFRVPKDQLFPPEKEQKENIQPIQTKATQRMHKKKSSKEQHQKHWAVVDRRVKELREKEKRQINISTFMNENGSKIDVGPLALDGSLEIQFCFTIKKK